MPEQALALQRDLDGHAPLLAVFNVTKQPVTFDWPEAAGAQALAGHGLVGEVKGTTVTLPAYGGWFGTRA